MLKKLNEEIVHFFENQGFVIVSSIDKNGNPHSSCKGIVKISPDAKIYLLDLYQGRTYHNLIQNPHISITAVDEHKFKGYCLKGKAKIAPLEALSPKIIKTWENRITSRITQRVLRNIHEEKGHPRHPEALLPKPRHLIVMKIKEIVDLTPSHLK